MQKTSEIFQCVFHLIESFSEYQIVKDFYVNNCRYVLIRCFYPKHPKKDIFYYTRSPCIWIPSVVIGIVGWFPNEHLKKEALTKNLCFWLTKVLQQHVKSILMQFIIRGVLQGLYFTSFLWGSVWENAFFWAFKYWPVNLFVKVISSVRFKRKQRTKLQLIGFPYSSLFCRSVGIFFSRNSLLAFLVD